MSKKKTTSDPMYNPLYAERLKKYDVPPPPYQPVFDRILIFQIETTEEETYKNSVILKADTTKKSQRVTSPRGILVAAGLGARDHLESHDVLIGDIVWFAKHSQWAYDVDVGNGRHATYSFVRSYEIVGSEDHLERIKSGKTSFAKDDDGKWVVSGRNRNDIDPSADSM